MTGLLLFANGKRDQSRKANKSQFPNKICYQTNKISSDQLALAGWSVARFLRLYPHYLESLQGHLGYICQGCTMTELVLHICHHWPHLNSAMAVVPKKQKAPAGGEGNVILLQCRNILQNGRG